MTALVLAATLLTPAFAGPIPGSPLQGDNPTGARWPQLPSDDEPLRRALELAIKDLERGDYDSALGAFKDVLQQHAECWIAEIGVGVSLTCLDRDDEAVTLLTKVLKNHEEQEGARMYRALALEKLGRFDRAMGDFDALVKLFPDEPWCRAHRGAIELQSNAAEKALEDFSALLDLKPEDPIARIGKASAQALKGEPEAAKKTLAALPPDEKLPANVLSLKAMCLGAVGEKRIALSTAVAAIDAAPQNEFVWHSLVPIFRRQFDPVAADKLFADLIAKHPGLPVAHYERGIVRSLGSWDPKLAVEAFEQAWKLDPDHFSQLFERLQEELPAVDTSGAITPEMETWTRHRVRLLAQVALRTKQTAWARSSLDSNDARFLTGADRAWILMRIEVAEKHFKEAVELLDANLGKLPVSLSDLEKTEEFREFCGSAEYHDWKFPPTKK